MSSFLGKVHGQNSRILERKLNLALLSHSPKNRIAKRAYGCFVIAPIKACSSILLSVVRPIEMLASTIIRLVGAAFVKNKKAELLKAKHFFLVRMPLSLVETVFGMVIKAGILISVPILILKNPIRYETKRLNDLDLNLSIANFKELIKDAQTESTKKRIQVLIKQLEKGIPVSLLETLKISYQVKRQIRAKFRAEMPRAEMPRVQSSPCTKSAVNILSLAAKYNITVSQETINIALNQVIDSEKKKIALKQVIRQLQLTLHPDKTIRMSEDERLKREEDMKLLNQALSTL